MILRHVQWLRGPNAWAECPVAQVTLDTHDVSGACSCSASGSSAAEAFAEQALALQREVGVLVDFAAVRETSEPHVYRVAIQYEEELVAQACLDLAAKVCIARIAGQAFDLDAMLGPLHELGDRVCLGPSTRAIVRAAAARGIPFRRLSTGSLVQLGQGKKQRRICTAETDRTSVIAETIAQDKQLTKTLLQAVGVPVPMGRPVSSPDDAWKAAREIGLPVVVKPRDANHGRGVALNLTTREQVATAFEHALCEGTGVLVEQFARGAEHRLLVVGDRLVAASRGEPEQIVGDGRRSIAEIVDELNRDPRRSEQWKCPLSPVQLDPPALILLEQQGYTPASVPSAGTTVVIHRNGDYTTDETDEVHPAVAAQAVLAAKAVGLDIAGVDLIVADIGQPLEPQGGTVVEVNAGPGLLMHVQPQRGEPRPVGEAIVATLFPPDDDGRIPLAAISGGDEAAMSARLLAHLLGRMGRTVGLACREGTFVAGSRRAVQDGSEPTAIASLLLHPLVDCAVCEVSTSGVLRVGLGFDRANVGIVTSAAGHEHDRHASASDLRDEDVAGAQRALVRSLLTDGNAVLSADDPAVAALAEHAPGDVTFFSQSAQQPLTSEHLAHGGRVVFLRDETLVLAQGRRAYPLVPLTSLPFVAQIAKGQDCIECARNAVLAAVAAAWSLGVPMNTLRAGLTTFGEPVSPPAAHVPFGEATRSKRRVGRRSR